MAQKAPDLPKIKQLPQKALQKLLEGLSDREALALEHDWPLWARSNQLPPPGDWRVWLILSGRGFGKTRAGAEWVREKIKTNSLVNIIGPTAPDYRDVMIEGESGILNICPPYEKPEWVPSRRLLRWPNGARTLCFSAEDPEQLRGPQHMALWCDEIAAWANNTRELTWDLAMFGLRLGSNPQVCATTTPKPVPLLRELVKQQDSGLVVVTKGTTYDNADNLAPAFLQQLIKKYEGTKLGRQELEAELLLDEGLAYIFSERIHVVPPFDVPPHWHRFEGFDHGIANPAAWIALCVDEDGNNIVQQIYYSPGHISEHAQAVLMHRNQTLGYNKQVVCFADPAVKQRIPKTFSGKEITVEQEYYENGLLLAMGQNDRRAGFGRISELMKPDTEHPYPSWHPLKGELGAPRLYFMDKEVNWNLIDQIRDAPIEDLESPLSRFPGETVDAEWEGRHGHAHAALRYALMSRPAPSETPEVIPEDPRAYFLWKLEKKKNKGWGRGKRYDLI